MKNTKTIVEGAILIAIYIVLLAVTVFVPPLSIILFWFLPLPFLLFTYKHTIKQAAGFFIVAFLLTILIDGGIVSAAMTLPLGLIGLVMGELYRRGKTQGKVFIGGSLAAIAMYLLLFVGADFLFHVNVVEMYATILRDSFAQSKEMLKALGKKPSDLPNIEEAITIMKMLVPSLIVGLGGITAGIIQLVSLPILKKLGITVEKGQPIRMFSFPKVVIWYYLVSLLLMITVKPDSTLYMVVSNFYYILFSLLAFQGICSLMAFLYAKGVPKSIQIIIVILSIVLMFPIQFLHILGIIDLGFDLRKKFKS